MGNTSNTDSSLVQENQELKHQLNYVHQQYLEERERGDQLIRDARFVAVSTTTILLLGGALGCFLVTKRFKSLENENVTVCHISELWRHRE